MSGNCKDEIKKRPAAGERLDLAEVQERLGKLKGRQYWRSLEELAQTESFKEMLHREFPRHAAVWDDGVSRRNFLQLMGASLALAGLAGCTKQPPENIIPYVRQPDEIIPGKSLYFATAMPLADSTIPLLVRSDMGRPIKVEGNPDHPAGSLGTDIFAQAAMLGMYDPDRSQTITELGELRTWGDFQNMLNFELAKHKQNNGAAIRFLTGAFTSPTLAAEMQLVLRAFPSAKWHMYEPLNRDNARAGAQMAFGQTVEPIYKLENADVILSLESDFLSSVNNPGFLGYAKGFASRKRAALKEKMNRLYIAESMLSQTGGKADHRLTLRSSDVEKIARAVAAKLGIGGGAAGLNQDQQKFVDAVAADLQSHRGASIVIAGETQRPAVHALAHAMNEALGNAGKTVVYGEPVLVTPPGFQSNIQSLRELADDINAGKVEMLVIWGVNPAYTAPDDFNFRHTDDQPNEGRYPRYSILSKVPMTIHFGLYQDETAQVCRWHVNEAHHLESWGDARTIDGTVTLLQPLIDPLYNGKTPYEFFGQFTDNQSLVAREWVHNYWNANHNTPDFETFWRKSVHDGFIADTQNAAKTVTAKAGNIPAASAPAEGMEIVFRPDSNIYDGRFANNGWLQELPRPITTITWDNAVYVSLNTARSLGIDVTDQQESTILELDLHGRKLESVAWVTPGVPDDSVTITLGYGRDQAGRTGNAHGYNAYLLRTSEAPLVASGLKLRNTLKSHAVASVHTHHNVSHEELGSIPEPAAQEVQRGIMRAATLEEFKKNPDFAHEKFEAPPMAFTLYKPQQHPYDPKNAPHKWGMAIDLNACIGCNTCVVACQSENNIPVVGQWEVRRGREMHWIRIDQYYLGDFANPEVHYMPVPCQQCENAPCEVVCPVGATVHSSEGLNDMVYNRCVGTRYCSNNCPYKVRRFNFMLYADYTTPQYKLMNNPDVTVRSRGVMEKCTYCIQRITHARIKAEELQVAGQGNGLVPDGSLKTACQQACPADAIVFGNMNDEKSRVNEWKAQPNNYGMLADLNTQPRTTYLAAVTNPNPALKSEAEQA